MSKQEISVLLETLSFFFVGIDLYGQERLRKMQENFLLVSEKVKNKVTNFQEFEWNRNRKSKFMKGVYVLAAAITITTLIVFSFELNINTGNFKDWIFWLEFLSGLFLIAALLFIFYLLLVLIALVIILITLIGSMAAINWIIRGAIWAFRFYQIEGVFLFIGTVLFLWSKYYQLYL